MNLPTVKSVSDWHRNFFICWLKYGKSLIKARRDNSLLTMVYLTIICVVCWTVGPNVKCLRVVLMCLTACLLFWMFFFKFRTTIWWWNKVVYKSVTFDEELWLHAYIQPLFQPLSERGLSNAFDWLQAKPGSHTQLRCIHSIVLLLFLRRYTSVSFLGTKSS